MISGFLMMQEVCYNVCLNCNPPYSLTANCRVGCLAEGSPLQDCFINGRGVNKRVWVGFNEKDIIRGG